MGSCLKIYKYLEKAEKKQRKAFMMENGKILLEQLIVSCNGKCNLIRGFSIEELKTATNNYNSQNEITIGAGYTLYRGFLQDYQVSIMKIEEYNQSDLYSWLNNVVFASQMNHRNILKLIGCCLEIQFPILVFEYVKYCYFGHYNGFNFEPLRLQQRIKIAMEIANAVTFLHIGFNRPIVFRDINSSHILLDEHYVPKLFNFSLAEFIPEGETLVRGAVVGTSGFGAPEYICTGDCNEKCDVYNFGILLLELLTGQRYTDLNCSINGGRFGMWDTYSFRDQVKQHIVNNQFSEIINPRIVGDGSCLGKEQHLLAFAELAFKCLSKSAEERPTMIEAAKELKQMYQSC